MQKKKPIRREIVYLRPIKETFLSSDQADFLQLLRNRMQQAFLSNPEYNPSVLNLFVVEPYLFVV